MSKKSKPLSPKQKRFCDFYLLTMNASEAARLAGYSAKTAAKIGSENLHKPDIMAYIDKRRAEEEELCQVSRAKQLRRINDVYERCAEPTILRDLNGEPIIRKVKVEQEDGSKEDVEFPCVAVGFDARGATAAIAELNKMMGYHGAIKVQDVSDNPFADVLHKFLDVSDE